MGERQSPWPEDERWLSKAEGRFKEFYKICALPSAASSNIAHPALAIYALHFALCPMPSPVTRNKQPALELRLQEKRIGRLNLVGQQFVLFGFVK